MGTYVVTGSASGIGAATAALLTERGHRVIGVDRAEADVVADLATEAGRRAAVREVLELAGGTTVNGVVPCAGLAGITGSDSRLLVSVNYFGAVDLVHGLRPALAAAAAAGEPAAVVLLASNSTTCQPGWAGEVARACLESEEAARDAAAKRDAVLVYPATKAALAWWARRTGTGREWAGSGIRVNAVAPGLIATAMTEEVRRDPVFGRFADSYPTALRRPGRPEEVAAIIAFLLSEEASLMVGSVVFVDGGTDALLHRDWPKSTYVPKPLMGVAMKALPWVVKAQKRLGR